MKRIYISDMTLSEGESRLSFKEKIEVARQLENLHTDVICLPEIVNVKADTLFVKTVSSFVKAGTISVNAGNSAESVKLAAASLSSAENKMLRVSLPVSVVGMEYECHRKPPKMLALIAELVAASKALCENVEFYASDATRADEKFLADAIKTAVNEGATAVTVCDNAAEMMPDDFAAFAAKLVNDIPELSKVRFGVSSENKNGMASAAAVLAAKGAATVINTTVGGKYADFETVAGIIKNCGDKNGICSNVKYTELSRGVKQICWIINASYEGSATFSSAEVTDTVGLCKDDDINAVIEGVKKLGYELSDEDYSRVYEEFCRVADKKNVTSRELDAIVASVALQVPPKYRLVSYIINNGNLMQTSAQIKLQKNGIDTDGISMSDGPIDAAFRTIDLIVGHSYELDDFQIQSVTEGSEAMGSATVRLRHNGKIYSGNGISTDIIGASIRAYINAINKIVYEEE